MKRSTLILSILLVLSVAGNLAVLGIFAGHWLRGAGPAGGPAGGDRLLGLIPEGIRTEIHESLHPGSDEARLQMEALRDARRAVNKAMRQRPFDADAANTALADLRTQTGRIQEKLHTAIVARMAAAQAAGVLPPPPGRGRGKQDRGPEPMDGPPPPPPPPGN